MDQETSLVMARIVVFVFLMLGWARFPAVGQLGTYSAGGPDRDIVWQVGIASPQNLFPIGYGINSTGNYTLIFSNQRDSICIEHLVDTLNKRTTPTGRSFVLNQSFNRFQATSAGNRSMVFSLASGNLFNMNSAFADTLKSVIDIIKQSITGDTILYNHVCDSLFIYTQFQLQLNERMIIVGGTAYNGLDPNRNDGKDMDYWVACMDTSGNVIYSHTFGGNKMDLVLDMRIMTDGNILLSGLSSSSANGHKVEAVSAFGTDLWFIKVNPLTGQIVWQNSIHDKLYDEILWIDDTPDNSILLLKGMWGPAIYDRAITQTTQVNLWLFKLRTTPRTRTNIR